MKKQSKTYLFYFIVSGFLVSCSLPGGNDPGTEYMPEMTHSTAYEANYYNYYHHNTWGGKDAYHAMTQPREPVPHTIPRGHSGIAYGDEERIAAMQGLEMNGYVPFPYVNTEEDRERASAEILTNPYPITADALADGEALYNIYCAICHGEKGDGEGYIISETNPHAVYPAQPAILTSDDFIQASNGQLYFAIMHGKNVMEGYADKLSYEERWNVIHYVRSLQANEKGLAYNETENTLDQGALPYETWQQTQEVAEAETEDEFKRDHSKDREKSMEHHE